jgi:hypothetical protein
LNQNRAVSATRGAVESVADGKAFASLSAVRYWTTVMIARQKPIHLWTVTGRWLVFMLAASSIACLLFDFYRLCPMRTFTLFIFLPALLVLTALAVADRLLGDRQLWRGVMIGIAAGLPAAAAYDVFRLPFVFANAWGIDSMVPQMDLFKVFPRFGAMILGESLEQSNYSVAAHLIGWAYHFSNGATFGVMFVATIGEGTRRHWGWAVLMAAGLELAMLFTPYTQVFGIRLSPIFVLVTLAAHLIFGAAIGAATVRLSRRWQLRQDLVFA